MKRVKTKKLFVLALIILQIFAFSTITAFADDDTIGLITCPNGEVYQLNKGESIKIPLQLISIDDEGIVPYGQGIITGNGGYIMVTDTPGNIHWSIHVPKQADSFKGTQSLTDYTTGLSCGSQSANKLYGDLKITSVHKKHSMGFWIDGIAYLGGKPVAKTSTQVYRFTAQ